MDLSPYHDKLASPSKAIENIRNGDRIFIGSGCGEPHILIHELAESSSRFLDTEIVHVLTLGIAPGARHRFSEAFHHNAFFVGDNVRGAIQQGLADFSPVYTSKLPHLFQGGRIPIDIALIQVSPPDKNGYFTYGVSVDVVKAATESARKVIAEVNAQMPRTRGDTRIHADEIDILVQSDNPLAEWQPPTVDPLIAGEIGDHISRLVEDGSTLYVGPGGMPNAALKALHMKEGLGIHTDLLSDPLLDLILSGAVTNENKSVHSGTTVCSLAMGTKRLYDFCHDNESVQFFPADYTGDPRIISKNDKMVSIVTGFEVDLTGQVSVDSLGPRMMSGPGSHVDFLRGASLSKGGRIIVALPSTALKGRVSRIVPTLQPGAGVDLCRGDVQYIVTEFGVASLESRSLRDRVLELVRIAHPNFRSHLLAQALKLQLIGRVKLPLADGVLYPTKYRIRQHFEGVILDFRPIKPSDDSALREFLYHQPKESLYRRFFSIPKAFPQETREELSFIDYDEVFSMVGIARTESGSKQLVAEGRYLVDEGGKSAEWAITVDEKYQDRGVGTYLLIMIAQIARSRGVHKFWAEILQGNRKALQLASKVAYSQGWALESRLEEGTYLVVFDMSSNSRISSNPQ
ncbi:MAG: GNAT family N-acetyltransferase [Candidatus Heimdallarchaeota archaeon]